MNINNDFVESLKEPSGWRGLIWLLVSLGVGITPEQAELIISVGAGMAGLLGMVVKDA